jgi:hypothetical protein
MTSQDFLGLLSWVDRVPGDGADGTDKMKSPKIPPVDPQKASTQGDKGDNTATNNCSRGGCVKETSLSDAAELIPSSSSFASFVDFADSK